MTRKTRRHVLHETLPAYLHFSSSFNPFEFLGQPISLPQSPSEHPLHGPQNHDARLQRSGLLIPHLLQARQQHNRQPSPLPTATALAPDPLESTRLAEQQHPRGGPHLHDADQTLTTRGEIVPRPRPRLEGPAQLVGQRRDVRVPRARVCRVFRGFGAQVGGEDAPLCVGLVVDWSLLVR
jgi:hypothetical protein